MSQVLLLLLAGTEQENLNPNTVALLDSAPEAAPENANQAAPAHKSAAYGQGEDHTDRSTSCRRVAAALLYC